MLLNILVVMLLVIGASGFSLAQPVRQTDYLQELRFFLTFVPNIQFSPFYVADAKGHFEDVGLDVVIEHGDENVGVDLVAAGELQFGVFGGEQVIMARASGRPVVFVYEWFQDFPVGIVVPDTTDAQTVTDLRGRKVGIPGRFGASYSGLVALLAANDMVEADIDLEPIGFAATDVVCVGGVEASVIYVNNEPLQIAQRAAAGECGDITDVTVLRVADQANMVSNGIVTNEATIANDPELVRAVVTAFDNGLRDAINNPAETYLISLDYVENLPINDDFRAALEEAAAEQAEFLAINPDREAVAESRAALLEDLSARFDDDLLIQFRVLLATIPLWDSDEPGHTDADLWDFTQEVVLMMGWTPGAIDLEGAFTNDFLPVREAQDAQ